MRKLFLCVTLFSCLAASSQPLFYAVPLTDLGSGLYLGTFEGGLYENGTNLIPADQAAAEPNITPDRNGRIVALSLGMSNWAEENCTADPTKQLSNSCWPYAFVPTMKAAQRSGTVNAKFVLVDCAQVSHDAKKWIDDSFGSYSYCLNNILSKFTPPIAESNVQIILWKNANGHPKVSLSAGNRWPCDGSLSATQPDACKYEVHLGQIARYAKSRYPNLQEMFVQSRIYAGFACASCSDAELNPEPYAYEYGFATQWFVQAQINQRRTGQVDKVAGDLLTGAPWLAWGAYLWAPACPAARSDGLCYVTTDFQGDGIHPRRTGITKVVNQLMSFYGSSSPTSWFRP